VKCQSVECVAIAIRVGAVMKAHSDFMTEPTSWYTGISNYDTSHVFSRQKGCTQHEKAFCADPKVLIS
jgi:hypothetical protein